MLVHLHVKNLALIEEAEVDFQEGLNILTGETGAGKSILIGSVNLALGQKMSRGIIREGAGNALVELVFQVRPDTEEKLKEMGVYPEEGQVIISRRITETRSISKVNGETCTASSIRKIAELLLDIHGQHDTSRCCTQRSRWRFWMIMEKSKSEIRRKPSGNTTENTWVSKKSWRAMNCMKSREEEKSAFWNMKFRKFRKPS